MTKKKNKKIFSISNKLRQENKSNDYFELMLNNLPLEDIIALKLEVSYRAIGTIIYGFPVWKNLLYIISDSVLKFGTSISNNQDELAKFLGVTKDTVYRIKEKYKTVEFFLEKENGIQEVK